MTRHTCRPRADGRPAFTLVELLVVIVILSVLIAVLMTALGRFRSAAVSARLASERYPGSPPAGSANTFREPKAAADEAAANSPAAGQPHPPPAVPPAHVRSFAAKVELTPRLSVGTAEPESIYEARCVATFAAAAPPAASGRDAGPPPECEIRLPLPPEIISLADLTVTVGGEPSDAVAMRDGALVWTGRLPAGDPTDVRVTYAAVGKGLYVLNTPPGRVLDAFDLELAANGSDVRMLELSLQPTRVAREARRTVYAWNYPRLMFGRPISVDVLGVAPVDRLGELRWLGPLSVAVFGLIVGLYAHAFAIVRFDRWMLLLTLGVFTGAYPLMYYAQEFIPLPHAVGWSAGAVLGVIFIRAWAAIGLRHAVVGVLVPAAASMAVALYAATHPQVQGLALTAAGVGVFLVAMVLVPRLRLPEGAGVMAAPVPAV